MALFGQEDRKSPIRLRTRRADALKPLKNRGLQWIHECNGSLGSSDFPTSTAASPPIGAPVSIEEHRATVLQRRDEAERLGNDIAELAARIQAATYELLVMIRAFDQREGWSGFKSCAHWLNWRTGLALGAAREKLRVARALVDLPLLSDAMRRGQLSYPKVRALTRAATPANERRLLGFAECAPASYVERLARAWCRVDRQAEATDERRRHERRNLTTWVDDDGMVVIRGRVSPLVFGVCPVSPRPLAEEDMVHLTQRGTPLYRFWMVSRGCRGSQVGS